MELIELLPFLEAREHVIDEHLSEIIGLWIESPDFVCVRPDGRIVGVELTKVMEDRDAVFWERLQYGKVQIDPFRTQETIHYLIERKEKARSSRYSDKVAEVILVLQLMDGTLNQLRVVLADLQDDFTSHGFSEIWIADYSGLEPYGDIELYGLFPMKWWGYHERPWPDRKPYG